MQIKKRANESAPKLKRKKQAISDEGSNFARHKKMDVEKEVEAIKHSENVDNQSRKTEKSEKVKTLSQTKFN